MVHAGGAIVPASVSPNRDRDQLGISLWRAKYKSEAEAAYGIPGKRYYLAVLRMSDLRNNGVSVLPDVEHGGPGHAVIPDLNAQNRRSEQAAQLERLLAESLTLKVTGPFITPSHAGK